VSYSSEECTIGLSTYADDVAILHALVESSFSSLESPVIFMDASGLGANLE
jgi:hypothetical protein